MPPQAIARTYRSDDEDWQAVRELLPRAHGAVGRGWTWDIRRWDGLRFHREAPVLPDCVAAVTGCWEDDDGRLVGVVHPEGGGDPFLELDPAWRHLEPEMVAWAEEHVSTERDGRRVTELLAWDLDEPRRALLAGRGYAEGADGWWTRWTDLELSTVVPDPPAGYAVRGTGEATFSADAAHMASLLNAAFGRTIHTAAEYRQFMRDAPAFRHDLEANAFCRSLGFAEEHRAHAWSRDLGPA